MTTSFAAFASQYLTKQPNQGAASLSSSQPLFFSFTTDDDGSRAGHAPGSGELDDRDDPHLRASGASTSRGAARYGHSGHQQDDDDDDPYLRLDEDEQHLPGASSRYAAQSIPLIASGSLDSPRAGWLAHQAAQMHSGSQTPSPSSETSSNSGAEARAVQSPVRYHQPPPPPVTSRGPISLSLTESLLPRDGAARPVDVFSLPDPRHVPRSRWKYNDSIWTSVYLALLTICLVSSIIILFLTHTPSRGPSPLPYTTLLHTVPLLTILTFTSAFVAYIHVWLLKVFVTPVMIGTSVFIPATLLISSIWAFVGSFMWEAGKEPTWGESVGLRLFSIIPLVLALLTGRRLVNLPRQIHTTSALLTLTTNVLLAHPLLLLVSPALLLAALILSIPFVTLIFRLSLVGAFGRGEWHVARGAGWAIAGVVGVWLWSWGVVRGVLRVICAGVVGAWYFADPELPPPPPMYTHTLHAAATRASGPSVGTIILSSLILTLVRILALAAAGLRLLPLYLPPVARPLAGAAVLLAGYTENATGTLSGHALVYVGLTGGPFWASATRVRALIAGAEGGYQRRFKSEPPLTLLSIAPLTLAFPFAVLTYLFVAHTLGAPDSALGAAVLAGGVTSLVGKFCIGVVRDTADTLYVCYCIDKDVGECRRPEVFEALEYNVPAPTQPTTSRPPASTSIPARAKQAQAAPPPQTPERGLPLSPPAHNPITAPLPQRSQALSARRVPSDDVDPFERSSGSSSDGEGEVAVASQLREEEREREEVEEEEEEQLFPGSDFF